MGTFFVIQSDISTMTHIEQNTSAGRRVGDERSKDALADTGDAPPVQTMQAALYSPIRLAIHSNDIQQEILSFLDVDQLRTMMTVNRRYRRLLVSDEGAELWKEYCCRQWPWLRTNACVQFVDGLNLPTTVAEGSVQPNYALLLSVATDKATGIDESLFAPPIDRSPRCLYCRRLLLQAKPETIVTATGHTAIQCSGSLVQGRISIRADQPMPSPKRHFRYDPESSRLLPAVWNPFVAPFVVQSGSQEQVHLTPRLISYYEVSILDPPSVTTDTRTEPNHLENGGFCWDDGPPYVAVGLATDQFSLYSAMPGWEPDSFGYHGDDGGIYHETGSAAVRQYGPLFGAGDTVGCGIDYLNRAIFFTLNGQFMGYAFESLRLPSLLQDLYPTVGLMNTKWPIQFNFGCDRPFLFDLVTMIVEQKEAVLQQPVYGVFL